MGFENVGQVWTPSTLKALLSGIPRPAWCHAITLHHTAEPSLAQRPAGLTAQHLRNIADFYRIEKGWSSGPHLFVDEDQLWGMSDFRHPGVHAVSFNASAIGIEVLGDYDSEDPLSGRGLQCWQNAAAAARVLLDWLQLAPDEKTVLFHRDDPRTTKTCPGRKVTKPWILSLIAHASTGARETVHGRPVARVPLAENEWQFVGERWCVPVRTYLLGLGRSEETIRDHLKRTDQGFFYGDELLEGAYYDAATESTWAPVRELDDLP